MPLELSRQDSSGTNVERSDLASRRMDASMNYGVLFALVLSMNAAACFAESAEWQRYQIPSTGTNVDIPVSIFTEDAGAPEGGTGRRFFTQDHRADLTIQSVPNPDNDSPESSR